MILDHSTQLHLSYCTNVHPGESLAEVENTLRRDVNAVRTAMAWAQPFGVGLRLAAVATRELVQSASRLDEFKALLAELRMYTFTLNGFPYGTFHGTPVKEEVYTPDWGDPLRLGYTCQLFAILEQLLPADVPVGTVSTLPGTFKPNASADRIASITAQLVQCCAELVACERRSGKRLVLALVPEPCCLLETTDATLSFFEERLLDETSRRSLDTLTGCGTRVAEELLRRHIGVCLDTCHAAVEFEPALAVYETLTGAGIDVAKVQISAGLIVDPNDATHLRALEQFDEPVYLHQVVQRDTDQLTRFVDLSDAFENHRKRGSKPADDAEWRVHFHVPISSADCGIFRSTRQELAPLLEHLSASARPPHLEVETYTWNVLPQAQRASNQAEAIASELRWAADLLRPKRLTK